MSSALLPRLMFSLVAAGLLASAAPAATIEVHMLNKGADGAMVFEPGFVAAQPGDIIRFVATDKGHNVEAIKGMLPEGVEVFKSKMGETFELTPTVEGVYGVKCTPHAGMGMVGLIQVGAPINLETAKAVPQKGKAAARFEADFAQIRP